ncbi:hypothetical protein [Streptomyces sparsogenes]|nr:hypothetical protein [Streptomyces sparsogenes]
MGRTELVAAGERGLLEWYGPRGHTRPGSEVERGAGHELGSEPVGGQALGQACRPLFGLPSGDAPLPGLPSGDAPLLAREPLLPHPYGLPLLQR